jgi:hypothetical protein
MPLLFCPELLPTSFHFALFSRSCGYTCYMMLEKEGVQEDKNLARKPHF